MTIQPKTGQEDEALASVRPAHAAPLLEVKTVDDHKADQARQERIRTMEERNQRMKRAEAEQDLEPEDEIVEPTPLHATRVPVSLHSIAGRKLLTGSNDQKHTPPKKIDATQSHGRRLLPILPEDIKLLQWRAMGMHFQEMTDEYVALTRQSRSITTVRARYGQVKKAVEDSLASQHLLDFVAAGDAAAGMELNELVGSMSPGCGNETPRPHKPKTDNFESRALPELAHRKVGTPEPAIDVERPHTAGKTLTPTVMQYYLECNWEALTGEDEEDSQSDSESLLEAEGEFNHWVYRVQRRQLSKAEVNDDEKIDDDVLWKGVGREYDYLQTATEEAFREMNLGHPDFPAFPLEGLTTKFSRTDEGLPFIDLTHPDVGVAQIQVMRSLVSFYEQVLPYGAENWVKKRVYFVLVEKTICTGDDIFEGQKETTLREPMDRKAYTSLEMANDSAIKQFVHSTFQPKSRNLCERGVEIQAQEGKWLDRINDDGADMFDQVYEDEFKKLRIWVENGWLEGPRN